MPTLKTPLFIGQNFNEAGKKKRFVFVKEISDGKQSFSLWHSAGKPEFPYAPTNGRYCLYAEINGYLIPLRLSEEKLICNAGYPFATERLFGNTSKKQEFYNIIRSFPDNIVGREACNVEEQMILFYGRKEINQVAYLNEYLGFHIQKFRDAKESDGKTFPDFIGACVLNELSLCCKLRDTYMAYKAVEKQADYEIKKAASEEIVKKGNEQIKIQIDKTMDCLRSGNVNFIEIPKIDVYKMDGVFYYKQRISALIYLFQQFGIDIPPRTKNWIEERLIGISVESFRCVSMRYNRAKKTEHGSQAAFKYINQLINDIKGKDVSLATPPTS